MILPKVIPLEGLNVDVRYGRELRKPHLRKMVRTWNDALCLPIVVNERDDSSRWVLDGFHRVSARRKLGFTDIVATLHVGLTYEQEANLFVELNRNRIGHRNLDQFRALVEGGHPACVEITQIVEELGGFIGHGGIECITTVQKLHEMITGLGLRYVLRIIVDSWGPENLRPPGADTHTLQAITHIWFSQHHRIERPRLVEALRKAGPEAISAEGHRVSSTRHSMSRATGTVIAIVDRYNHGLHVDRRIEAEPMDRRLLERQAAAVLDTIRRLKPENDI